MLITMKYYLSLSWSTTTPSSKAVIFIYPLFFVNRKRAVFMPFARNMLTFHSSLYSTVSQSNTCGSFP